MPTLIIPDIHENIPGLQRLLAVAGPVASRIFLGDWFDSFTHTSETSLETILWLKTNLLPTDTLLWGNHDIPYAYRDRRFSCTGNHWLTHEQLNNSQAWEWLWPAFKLWHNSNGWTFSHAGFAQRFAEAVETLHTSPILSQTPTDLPYPLLGAGRARGGDQAVGGVTWLDWREEFDPIPELNQIVGHTCGRLPRTKFTSVYGTGTFISSNLCLDTELQHFAILQDSGAVDVFAVADAAAPLFTITKGEEV